MKLLVLTQMLLWIEQLACLITFCTPFIKWSEKNTPFLRFHVFRAQKYPKSTNFSVFSSLFRKLVD
jgi:hypothetical protein